MGSRTLQDKLEGGSRGMPESCKDHVQFHDWVDKQRRDVWRLAISTDITSP